MVGENYILGQARTSVSGKTARLSYCRQGLAGDCERSSLSEVSNVSLYVEGGVVRYYGPHQYNSVKALKRMLPATIQIGTGHYSDLFFSWLGSFEFGFRAWLGHFEFWFWAWLGPFQFWFWAWLGPIVAGIVAGRFPIVAGIVAGRFPMVAGIVAGRFPIVAEILAGNFRIVAGTRKHTNKSQGQGHSNFLRL